MDEQKMSKRFNSPEKVLSTVAVRSIKWFRGYNCMGEPTLTLRVVGIWLLRDISLAWVQRAEDDYGVAIKGKYWSYAGDEQPFHDDCITLPESDNLAEAIRICEAYVFDGKEA